ncbi:MAG: tRNA pseudouridine(38-40) synthase TruA [Pontibacterium sp.]
MPQQEHKDQQGAIDIAPYRYALCIEYQGANYRGWQIQQDGVPSIQAALEKAISKVANHPVSVVCAGRTDACVNATYQIVHFDSTAVRSERAWVLGTNTHLPDDVSVRWAKPVSESFHARFGATARRYRYLIYSSPVKPALLAKGVTWTYKTLDVERMHQAGQCLVGEHNFNAYRAVNCQAHSPVRTVKHLNVYKTGDLIVIDVRANAFLHHMIRNFAGVLMSIGAGEADIGWAQEVLDSQDRRQGGVTAPPYGLYFVDVTYPDEFELPPSDIGPFFLSGSC